LQGHANVAVEQRQLPRVRLQAARQKQAGQGYIPISGDQFDALLAETVARHNALERLAGESNDGTSLDETWAKTNMTRRRAPCGERLVAQVPHGHWKTTTFLAALRVSGLTAPLVVDGAINGEIFRGYVEQHLVPTLRPGDIVILDNLSAHKVAGVQKAIECAPAQLWYLPPYSPDFNPIELVFAKLKRLLRSAADRTVDTLWRRCGELLDQSPETECRNYLRHCGYRYV
jgi:transposase